jgi:hypothetical protein
MTKNNIDFEQDKASGASGELSAIADMVQTMQQAQDTVTRLEKELKEAQSTLHRIEHIDLPELMTEFGVTEFTTRDGTQVIVDAIISGSIPSLGAIKKCKDAYERDELAERRQKAFAYLEQHGAGALIKNILAAEVPKGEQAQLQAAIDALQAIGLTPHNEQSVHHSSLNSWLKERTQAGEMPDADIFKIYNGNRAVVKKKKR